MNRYFTSLFLSLLVFVSSAHVFAVDGTTTPLSISSVKVTDNKNIRVTFSESIDADSVVLKIMKQSDNSTVKTNAIAPVIDTPEAVDINLDDVLTEASSYTLTVVAAIGKSGATVIDGATALQDFVTPSPLKIAGDETMNAPSNPNAVMTPASEGENPSTPTQGSDTMNPSEPTKLVEPAPTEELPLTGPNTYIFLLVAFLVSFFLLRKKSI